MLKKLLKYDIRSMMGLWRVFSILLPCIAVGLPVSFRLMSLDYSTTDGYMILLQLIVYFIFIILMYAAMAVLIINPVFLGKRIARDFYSRTAQLTLTLPVKRDDLFLSKLINSIKTDHEEYFIWVCEKMNASPLFTQAEWNAPFYPKTDFQKQWEAMGKPIFSARFIRNNA